MHLSANKASKPFLAWCLLDINPSSDGNGLSFVLFHLASTNQRRPSAIGPSMACFIGETILREASPMTEGSTLFFLTLERWRRARRKDALTFPPSSTLLLLIPRTTRKIPPGLALAVSKSLPEASIGSSASRTAINDSCKASAFGAPNASAKNSQRREMIVWEAKKEFNNLQLMFTGWLA